MSITRKSIELFVGLIRQLEPLQDKFEWLLQPWLYVLENPLLSCMLKSSLTFI